MKSSPTSQFGFTLIEMIVSLGLFSIVITISVGALLVLIATNEQLQAEQSVMTNLSFALDSMTREIRTGTNYYCASRPNYSSGGVEAIFDDGDSQESLGQNTNDCPTGQRNRHCTGGFQGVGARLQESGSSGDHCGQHRQQVRRRGSGAKQRSIPVRRAR